MTVSNSFCRWLLSLALAGAWQVGVAQTVSALRLDRLEAEIQRAEDIAAIKRLQRAYGYYLDKGLWEDLGDLFTDDAVANYPAGVYIGEPSIRRHLYMNVGGGEIGDIGLGDGRLYNHMNLQPVVHLDPGGETAKGRWRAFAMFGRYGGGAVWAEGVYEMGYVKQRGVWKIRTLDYHAGFGAPYETGWVDTGPRQSRARGALPHPADRERNMPCEGFPEACLAPFHYANPGTRAGGLVWPEEAGNAALSSRNRGDIDARAADLARRAALLRDTQAVENLQKVYGYYLDRALWQQVADLFSDDGTIELGLQGVYEGPARIREFLSTLGPEGLEDGWLNDHLQLQIIATVAADGMTAKVRSRELGMTGRFEGKAYWSEGVYENTFVKQDGNWKIRSVRLYPTFITDYDQGWAKDAQAPPGISSELPPDREATEVYEIYPQAHVPAFHYDNPVTGNPPVYPRAAGRPSRAAIRAATAPVPNPAPGRALQATELDALVAEAERQVARAKDYHELENLESAYGYYLDKNLWDDLADLFAANGSMELARRGIYKGQARVRGFLHAVFGRGGEGPVAGRLGNHVQMQPVIHIAPDGSSAHIRVRMMQQLNFGERASMGGSVYENVAVKEDGVWKFSTLHTFNTWTAGYDGGWAKSPGRFVPGPSESYPPDGPPTLEFTMFPAVYDIPFHYDNPVTGRRVASSADPKLKTSTDTGMPTAIAAELRNIGARIEAQQTAALYAPLQPQEPYAGTDVMRDLSYGPHERNVLDLFRAAGTAASARRPVVVFVHGGGFSRGSKHTPGSPFYDNVMLWAVAKGLVGVNINYRLAPEFTWPAGIEDLDALVAWLKANVARHGGDPERIFLWGHSAGAAHVADYIAAAALDGRDDGLAGAILTSGFYDLGDEVSVWAAYYGDDVSTYRERSSLPGLLATTTPLLVNDAELDPESFQLETRRLIRARAAAGRPVQHLHLLGHSHLSETYAVGTSDRTLSGPVHEFIQGLVAH